MEILTDSKIEKKEFILTPDQKKFMKEITGVIWDNGGNIVDIPGGEKTIREYYRKIETLENILIEKSFDPKEYYLFLKLSGGSLDPRVKYFDTNEKDIENFIRNELLLEKAA